MFAELHVLTLVETTSFLLSSPSVRYPFFLRFASFMQLLSLVLNEFTVVPTFVTNIRENLCSGWVFLSSDNIRLFNWPFLTDFFKYHSKGIVDLSLNLKKCFTCKVMGD